MWKFIVYRHTSPSGKVYVGITHQKPIERWLTDGSGYKRHPHFYNAILKYGWDNFKHEILLEDRTESEAKYAERYLIKWYKLHNNCYNVSDGGDYIMDTSKAVLQYDRDGNFIKEWHSAREIHRELGIGYSAIQMACRSKGKRLTKTGYRFCYKEDNVILAEYQNKCFRPVVQYDLNLNKIAEYSSLEEASKVTGLNVKNLVLNPTTNYEYVFFYKEIVPSKDMIKKTWSFRINGKFYKNVTEAAKDFNLTVNQMRYRIKHNKIQNYESC